MTTLTVTLVETCSGGEHLVLSVTGDRTAVVRSTRSTLSDTISDEEIESFVKVLIRMVKAGRTLNQTRTQLQNGVTITV